VVGPGVSARGAPCLPRLQLVVSCVGWFLFFLSIYSHAWQFGYGMGRLLWLRSLHSVCDDMIFFI
jgi:hypothetical protein